MSVEDVPLDPRRSARSTPTAPSAPDTLSAYRPGKIHIGISGWRYKGWRGVFYPDKLPHRRELEFASRTFDTIELNGTFYSLQSPLSFSRWHMETPDDFTF